jgi:hypothetical protein
MEESAKILKEKYIEMRKTFLGKNDHVAAYRYTVR